MGRKADAVSVFRFALCRAMGCGRNAAEGGCGPLVGAALKDGFERRHESLAALATLNCG